MRPRRICLYGGPGIGKSTKAAKLYVNLKEQEYNVELIREKIKTWVYEGREPIGYDQLTLFAKHLKEEEIMLNEKSGIDLIITDCPILNICFYTQYNDLKYHDSMLEIALMHEQNFPATHCILNREGVSFKESGRYHDEQESKEIDIKLKDYLNRSLEKIPEDKRNLFDLYQFSDIYNIL